MVWSALQSVRADPAGAGIAWPAEIVTDQMSAAEMFGCTKVECDAMFNYIVWNGVAESLGFSDVRQMQDMNSAIDFTQPPIARDVLRSVYSSFVALPTTTIDPNILTPTTVSLFDEVILIDGGAPNGAMEDAYQRLAGYNRTFVPGIGRTFEQTLLMPVGDNTAMATAVGGLLGLDGFDTWDPSLVATPMQAMVAVVIGPDYFERVQGATPTTSTPATTTTIVG